MPRPRRRLLGLSLGAAALFAVGTHVQAGWLLAMASMLLGAAVAGVALPAVMVRGVVVERRAPPEAFAGDDVAVDLVVRNRDRGPKLSVVLRDPHIAPSRSFVPLLGPGEHVVVSTVRRAARRGVVDAGPVTVSSGAPFGVAEARRALAAPGRTVVYPRVVPLSMPAALEAPTRGSEAAPRPRPGAGEEFLATREYRPGDSLRHVHWPSTARRGTLIVREFEREREARLGIVLDTSADAGDGESALDVCCSIAASLALDALAAGRAVTLAAARTGAVEVLEGPGARDALTWLAELRAPGGMALAEAAERAAPRLAACDTAVLVFPTWRHNAPGAAGGACAAVEEAGPRVVAVVVDAASFDPTRRDAPAQDAAGAAALANGLRARFPVYRVRAGEDLASCLAEPIPIVG